MDSPCQPGRPPLERLASFLFWSALTLTIVGLLLACLAPMAHAGWGAGGCGPVGPAVASSPSYRWVAYPDTDAEVALFLGNVQVGGYRFAPYQEYLPRVNGVWGEPCEPPVTPPEVPAKYRQQEAPRLKKKCPPCDCPNCPCGKDCCCLETGKACVRGATVQDGKVNFGLDVDAIEAGRAQTTINGRPVSKQQAIEAIMADTIPDDAGKRRLTVIGSDAERQKVLQDLAGSPALAPLKDALVVQDYAPTDWPVASGGFQTGGHPTVYLQAPDGKVLYRRDDYQGPEKLAEAVRKADPAYDPKKDPNGDPLKLPFDLNNLPPAAWAVGGGLLALVLVARAKR